MSLQTRFATLLGLILVLFLSTLAWQHALARRDAAAIFRTIRAEREQLLDRILDLTGASLQTFAADYSLWDDMVAFAQAPDEAWAKINIDASLPNFNAAGAWVFKADGTQAYAVSKLPSAQSEIVALFSPTDVRDITRRSPRPHFYVEISAGLLEVRGSPLQPSHDSARQTEPQGWFFVGRLWDAKFLNTLAHLNRSVVSLTQPDESPGFPDEPLHLRLQRPLLDVAGHPVRVLHLDLQIDRLRQFLDLSAKDVLPFLGYGVITIALIVGALVLWVLRPLHLIGQSLAEEDPRAIRPLVQKTHELGRIARLVQTAAEQRVTLQTMLAERARLGRDLHDSVIQTIYACGMGVMSARLTLRSDPAASERTLEQIGTQFNDIIHDLRGFIMGLEPEMLRHRTFRDALDAIADNFRATHSVAIDLHVDETTAHRFTQPQQVHILHIVRECISNALRHGQASAIAVTLRTDGSNGLVEISDDGRGFQPETVHGGNGRGLANLSERTNELAGTLFIDSLPEQNTRIRVTIPLSSA